MDKRILSIRRILDFASYRKDLTPDDFHENVRNLPFDECADAMYEMYSYLIRIQNIVTEHDEVQDE